MIRTQGIQKRFKKLEILRDATMEVKAGQLTLLTGANGSGKSTFLKILTGLLSPGKGTATIGEFEIQRHRRKAQQLISFLPQSVMFHPAATPLQLLAFYGRLRHVAPDRGKQLLRQFDLEDAARRPVSKLSGGMLQRLGLILVLLPNAPVIILDEPDLSLDPDWRSILRKTLREEADKGKAILLTSHFSTEWEDIRDVVWDCREGQFIPTYRREATLQTS